MKNKFSSSSFYAVFVAFYVIGIFFMPNKVFFQIVESSPIRLVLFFILSLIVIKTLYKIFDNTARNLSSIIAISVIMLGLIIILSNFRAFNIKTAILMLGAIEALCVGTFAYTRFSPELYVKHVKFIKKAAVVIAICLCVMLAPIYNINIVSPDITMPSSNIGSDNNFPDINLEDKIEKLIEMTIENLVDKQVNLMKMTKESLANVDLNEKEDLNVLNWAFLNQC